MDSLLNAAARALAAGDPLSALNRVSLRQDAPALALRGIAMAQLGDHERARQLLKLAARRFGPQAPVAHARCLIAEAEVCLATRELHAFPRGLSEALETLAERADARNALHGRLLLIRRAILLGRLDTAAQGLEELDLQGAPPVLLAIAELSRAEVHQRRVQAGAALETLKRAHRYAAAAKISALKVEVEKALELAEQPAALLLSAGVERLLPLRDVESLFAGGTLVADGCRRALHQGTLSISLAKRPVLFALLSALAREPAGVDRSALIWAAFAIKQGNESHRSRLRVEIGRLRKLVRSLCDIEATKAGFRLSPRAGAGVVVLLPPLPGEAAALQALLADGQAWSTSALALALGESQRNVQRSLAELEAKGRVRSVGRGRAQRWVAAPLSGFATTLLLPLNVASG